MTQTPNTASGGTGPNNPSLDFVDFYQVLETEQEATTTHLRRRINDLYSEAQSNRDHRNVGKRRRYEALCELLPYCRIVLLDPDKRARYDRYLELARSGGAGVPDFETIMEEIAGSIGDGQGEGTEKIGLLGLQGDDDYLPVSDDAVAANNGHAHTLAEKSAVASNATSVAPTVADSVTLTAKRKPARKKVQVPAYDSLAGSAVSVLTFSAIFALIWFFRHNTPNFHLATAVGPAALAGFVVWLISHARKGGGTRIK